MTLVIAVHDNNLGYTTFKTQRRLTQQNNDVPCCAHSSLLKHALCVLLAAAPCALHTRQTPPSLAAFQGTGPSSRGKSLVDIFLFKWDCGNYILNDWAPSLGLNQHTLSEIRAVMRSVDTYRSHCGYPMAAVTDHTFRAGWSSSCEELFTLVEAVCFDVAYDPMLKECLKSNGSPSDFIANHVHEVAQRVKVLLEAERQAVDEDDDIVVVSATLELGSGPAAKRPRVGDACGQEADKVETESPVTQAARRLINTHITLIPDSGGPDARLAERIAATKAGSYIPSEHGQQGRGYVFLVFDSATQGESTAHPHLRKPPLQPEAACRAVTAGMMARKIATTGDKVVDAVGDEDLWLLFDGGRSVEHMMLKGFKGDDKKAIQKAKFPITITYDEETLVMPLVRVAEPVVFPCLFFKKCDL